MPKNKQKTPFLKIARSMKNDCVKVDKNQQLRDNQSIRIKSPHSAQLKGLR